VSGFLVPQSVPSTQGWTFIGWKDPAVVLTSAPAGVDGFAVATGPQIPPGEQWLIDRAVASCTSSTTTQLRLYDSQQAPAFLLDSTPAGNADVTEYPAGLLLAQSTQLVAAWSSASPGAVGTLRTQIRVYRYAAG
jgi:hypothetical protein